MRRSNLPLAKQLLANQLADHQESVRKCGGTNYGAARCGAEVSLLLEFPDLLQGFRKVLNCADPTFWNRFLHPSLARAKEDPLFRAVIAVRKPEIVRQKYPLLREEYFKQYPLDSIADTNFEGALSAAATQFDKECVLLTRAVLGQIDEAVAASQQLTESSRKWNVVFVAAIEAFRRDDPTKGTSLLNSLPPRALMDWGGAQMALGVAGFVPWIPYPYPDY